MDELTHAQSRTVRDYRLALGLAITHMRESANLATKDVTVRTGIPEQTLRSYERGNSQPQIERLLMLTHALNAESAFDLLIEASKYIYRACGRHFPEHGSPDCLRMTAVLLYCGASLDDVDVIVGTEDH